MSNFWARHRHIKTGPHVSREIAAQRLFSMFPKLKAAMTGYGSMGPDFDIRWIDRDAPRVIDMGKRGRATTRYLGRLNDEAVTLWAEDFVSARLIAASYLLRNEPIGKRSPHRVAIIDMGVAGL